MHRHESTEVADPQQDVTTVGEVVMDFLPVPHPASLDPEAHETANSMAETPTLSHSLAVRAPEEQGAVQQRHCGEDVADLGWNEKKEAIAAPLVGGMDNEELWKLIRRFNKQMYHVRECSHPVPGELDLNIADEEEFSPDKLRANIERLYMTVVIGIIGLVKHVARLRSWREAKRTSIFCMGYFAAWALDLVMPALCLTIIVLIIHPPSRSTLFPPAPIALVSAHSGGLQKPKAGVLGSHDSATGAPENHKGEAVEQEASNFYNSIASIALTGATGKHPQAEPVVADDGDLTHDTDVAAGAHPTPSHDKTKIPVETAMWTKMRPVMHGIADISDTWERFGNALSPTPPFPKSLHRLRIATLVAPLFLVSLFLTSYMLVKAAGFAAGFIFFGEPVISRLLALLDRRFPHWERFLELRNTILKGVPTNAQLALTLLRIGEANKAPLPPPPRIPEPPLEKPAELTDQELRATGAEPPLNATDEEIEHAMAYDPRTAHETGGDDIDASRSSKHGKKGDRLLSFFKVATRNAVKTTIGADSVRAKAGSHNARDRLGALPKPTADWTSGPIEFKARYKGHKGHVYLTTKATIPAVAFSAEVTVEKIGAQNREDLHPLWSFAIADLKDLKKIGGYGWKAKLVVGWSMGREVADGLEITTRDGKTARVTAMPLRDELFNRLIAIGGQKWEAW
ncbi:hypothetical protein GQ53DRAFT_885822 [Thozetella sp. PMI_491]|nr:hypothetical protein GQ53DRAFT_885822 [Thozetella sp. PMI_491]